MKKLLLLLCALLTGVSGAWADGLKVSTTESASAEYQYKIFCRNAPTYYLGNTTNATNSVADYGLFAFFAANGYENGYFIYSIFEGKWVTYTAGESYSEGKNKISLVADKPTSPWNIAADNSDNKYYDIRPFKTDKTVDDVSWNWHGGTTANTTNTMGFYDYTDGNSGWGIVLAGGSGSPVADRKVVALYNVPSDNNEYPLYNSSGSAKVYNATSGQTPQYFILRQNGLDGSGEALYRLQKAEADGNYLNYQSFGTSEMNYLFLNTSSSFFSYYTYSSSATSAESPYYDFFRKWPNATDNSSRPYSNQVAQCNDGAVNMYSSDYNALPVPRGAKGNWNGRWKVAELAGYTAWQVVMSGATSGTVTYNGSALISGGTAAQSNNGMFVLSATPTASDFTASVVDGYLTDPSVTIDSDRKLIKVAYTEYASIRSTIVNFLANTPETIGYPTSAARATLQAAIDAFDASSKVTSDLVTLNTAYTTFQSTTDVNLPELGKIYTIQNYIKSNSLTTYLKNEDGTLTIGADASATPLNNLWVVRKSGNTYVLQSAADPTKYIVCTSFLLAASGSTWTFSQGTERPYISMFNSTLGDSNGRFVASNGSNQFGTAGGSGYYASARTQYSGWSTDFKFVESTDYALYKVKFIFYPQGTDPTITYNTVAYSNGADFIAPTNNLTTSDLSVSSIDGYTSNITIDGDVIYVNYEMKLNQTYADTWDFDSSPWSLLDDVPTAIDNSSRTYRYNTKLINIATTYNSSVVVKFAYSSGNYRIDVAGVDLLNPSTGEVVKSDYHDGYSGSQQLNREYNVTDVAPGNYILRYISYGQSTSSAGNITVCITPHDGFYRIKGYSENYITSTSTTGTNAQMNGTANANNIVYYNADRNLIFYGTGYGLHCTHTVAPVGSILNSFAFTPGAQVGKYYLVSNARTIDSGDFGEYCYDHTDNGNILNRNSSPVTSGSYQTDWTVEEVTSLPVTFKGQYASFFSPVDLTLPDGVQAFTGRVDGNSFTLTSVDYVPANTGVILKFEAFESETSKDFPIRSTVNPITGTSLTGTTAAMSVGAGTTLVLGKSSDKWGIYKYGSTGTVTLGGFKAYMNMPSSGSVKGFAFNFDLPTIVDALNAQEASKGSIYNLAGQRVNKAQKGIYIVNGKKVAVK